MSKRKKNADPPPHIPYVRGFKAPTPAQKERALGPPTDNEHWFSVTADWELHQSLPRCTSVDDWLAQYKEVGQTVPHFLRDNPWFCSRKWKYMKQKFVARGSTLLDKYPDGRIYLLPVGQLPVDISLLVEFAELFLGVPFSVLAEIEVEKKGKKVLLRHPAADDGAGGNIGTVVETRTNNNGRFQLNVTSALKHVRSNLEKSAKTSLAVIGLTQCEMYDTKPDLFVAGMASGNERIALFSVLRYHPNLTFSPEHWYHVTTKPKSKCVSDEEVTKLMLARSLKLLVHETMHLLGLEHCIYFDCIMNGSGHLEEDYKQSMFLCPVCLKKMYLLVKFDVLDRYKDLMKFYETVGMDQEFQWVKKKLKILEK